MNNQCYEVLKYICSTQFKEKQILFEYFFDRCKETNKLKCLLENALNIQEENLFFSYLKRHNDTESITCHLLFLLHRGRYLEAGELNASLKNIPNLKFNDTLTITSLLVKRYEKNIPTILKQKYDRHPIKCVYKNTDIAMKCMNSDSNKFVMNTERDTVLRKRNLSEMSSNYNSNCFLLPMSNYTPERPAEEDIIYNEKRRKINDSPDKVYDEIIKPIGNNVLDILNTPLVEKTVSSPFVSNISSILKPGSAVKDKRVLSIIDDEISVPKTVLRFSLPDDNSIIEPPVSAENTNMPKADIQEHNRCYNIQNYKHEEMDVSEECSYSEPSAVLNQEIDKNSSIQTITLSSDDEDEQNHKPVLTLLHEHNNSNLNEDNYNIEPLFQHNVIEAQLSIPISIDTNENVDHRSMPIVNVFNSSPNNQDDSNNSDEFLQDIKSSNSDTYSQGSIQVIKCLSSDDNDDSDDYDDGGDDVDDSDDDGDNDDLIIVDSGDEVENVQSDTSSSSTTSLGDSDVSMVSSDDSDLENTRYGRFKSTKKNHFENSESEEENVEQCTQYSGEDEKNNLEVYDDICDEDESNFQQQDIKYYDETEEDNLKPYNLECNQTNEEMYVLEEKDETEGDNLKPYDIESNQTNEEMYVLEEKDETEGGNLKPYDIEFIETNEEMYVLEDKDETEGDNLKPYDVEFIETNEEIYVPEEKDETEGDNLKPYDKEFIESNEEMYVPEEKNETEGDNLKPYDIEFIEKNEEMYVPEEKDNVIYSNVLESSTNNLTCSFDFVEESSFIDNDHNISVDQQIDDSTKKTQITNEILNTDETSSHIIGDDLNQSTITVSSQLGTFNVNAIQSTPFLFGESFFGEQVPKSQPMLLFGQVYSFENEQFVVDSNNDKPETQALNTNDHEEVLTNKEIDDVELVDDIQDILELESLPESEVDDNVYKPSQSNSIEQEVKETNSLLDYQSSVPLDHSHLSTTIISGNTDSPDLKTETQSLLTSPVKELCNTDNISQNESYVEIDQINIINPIETKSEKLSCDVIDRGCSEVSLISQNADNVQTSSQSSSAINKKIETQKSFNSSVITRSKRAKSVSVCSNIDDHDKILNVQGMSNTLDPFSQLKLVKDPVLQSKSMSLSPTNISKKNDSFIFKDIDLKNESTQCIQQVDTCVLYVNKDTDESHKLITNDSVELINFQENTQKVPCINQGVSLRKNVTKSKVNYSGSNENTQLPNTKKFEEVVESTLKPPYINKKINEDIKKRRMSSGAKSIPLPDTNVITTRSRTRSESNLIELDTSLNIFRSSVIDVNSRQTRVLLSRKRSTSQQNLIPTRRSGRSKSLAPLEEEISTNRRAVFGLEKISEENTLQSESDFQVKNSKITRKSKFNFGSKKSKSIEPSSLINEPCDTRIIKTPRRSKSVQPDPVLTYSMVKTKPKQSASVDSLHLKNQSSTEIDFMDVLTMPLKIRKRSSSESAKNKKNPKMFKNVNEAAQSDFIESDQMSNKQLSPIPGGNMKHMLMTPVRKHLKHISPDQSICSEASFIDSDSNHVMTRSMNQSIKSSVSKRGVRNCKMCNTKTTAQDNMNELHQLPSTSKRPITRLQQTILEKSLQSIGQEDNNTSVSAPKPEIQKTLKKAKQKNVNK